MDFIINCVHKLETRHYSSTNFECIICLYAITNSSVLVLGSNQGGNNLTLKGWPLTVSSLEFMPF